MKIWKKYHLHVLTYKTLGDTKISNIVIYTYFTNKLCETSHNTYVKQKAFFILPYNVNIFWISNSIKKCKTFARGSSNDGRQIKKWYEIIPFGKFLGYIFISIYGSGFGLYFELKKSVQDTSQTHLMKVKLKLTFLNCLLLLSSFLFIWLTEIWLNRKSVELESF